MNAPKIALLAASGVSEHEMTAIARALATTKQRANVISPDSGLIHSWGEGTWGHCYPVDAKLETSLGSDFDMLVLPGGERHIAKLMGNAHTRRFVTAFFAAGKPVAVFAEAQTILATNGLTGDNALLLTYDSAEALNEGCMQMVSHFENNAVADDLAEAA